MKYFTYDHHVYRNVKNWRNKMAVKTISIYACDLCKNEFNDKLNTISMPVIFHTEQTEGRPCEPYLTTKKIELCQKCIDKTVILHGSGCMGNDEFYIKGK